MPSRLFLDDSPPAPRYTTQLALAAARQQEKEAAERRKAGITAADMLLRLGCHGPGCQAGHDGHLAQGRQVLMILGVMPDPEAKGNHSPYGYIARQREER